MKTTKKVADEFFSKTFKRIEKDEFSPVVLTDAQSGKKCLNFRRSA
ncbi:MAG: hypothetical protein L6V93_01220 [Clostridiales bacterium]|nr:MAG: hypothetical protein L6V93_01220 [Clostridiales bacterium]